MVRKGLPTYIKQKIWQAKTLENKKYREIQDKVLKEDNMEISANQVREVIREMKHGNRYGKNIKQREAILVNTGLIRQKMLERLDKLLVMLEKDPKQVPNYIQAIKTELNLARDIDVAGGRFLPRTQINIQINKLEAIHHKKFDLLVDWWMERAPRKMLEEFEGYVGEVDKIVDAEFETVEGNI